MNNEGTFERVHALVFQRCCCGRRPTSVPAAHGAEKSYLRCFNLPFYRRVEGEGEDRDTHAVSALAILG